MSNRVIELIRKEYGLNILGCVITELSGIPGFEKILLTQRVYDGIAEELANEAAAVQADENENQLYAALHSKLNNILPDKLDKIKKIIGENMMEALI